MSNPLPTDPKNQGAASSAISGRYSNAQIKQKLQAQLDKQAKAASKVKLPAPRGGQAMRVFPKTHGIGQAVISIKKKLGS